MSSATGANSSLKGTGYQSIQTPTKNAQQMGLFDQLYGGSKNGIDSALRGLTSQAQGGNEDYWSQLEAPARREFGQLQGNIASRFSRMGSGARRSSGHQNAQSGAATDFAERLGANRINLQKQAWDQLLGMGSHLFDSNLMETSLIPKKKKWWESLGEGIAGVGGNISGIAGGYGLGKKIFD